MRVCNLFDFNRRYRSGRLEEIFLYFIEAITNACTCARTNKQPSWGFNLGRGERLASRDEEEGLQSFAGGRA